MSGVDDLFGSDDEEPQQRAASPAAAPKPTDMKARLAALAAAKKRERVSWVESSWAHGCGMPRSPARLGAEVLGAMQ